MEFEALKRFSVDILTAAGAVPEEAVVVSENLAWCDAVGRRTQGVWRLPIITERLRKGLYSSPCNLEISMRCNTIGQVDANNGMGHYVTGRATTTAIETAQQEGVCSLTMKNSNYHGASGYYASQIANAGLLGLVCSNSFPKVIPYQGQVPALGTNPFAFACPSSHENKPLLVDMATSEQAGSTLRKQVEDGQVTTDTLFSFGGSKGFGLSLMVEILAGVLSGGGVTNEVNSLYKNFEKGGNSGHFILAIDISRFMPLEVFAVRMNQLFTSITGPGNENVRLPGQCRWQQLEISMTKGIKIDQATIKKLSVLGNEYEIDFDEYI